VKSLDNHDYSNETKFHNKTGLQYDDSDADVILRKISVVDYN